jgi:uncharacterized protein (TIGR03083 family)
MNTSTGVTTDVTTIPRIDRREAVPLAEHEYRRFLDLLRDLEPGDWSRPTDCSAWDVRKVALHVLGAAEAGASAREMARQLVRGRRLFARIGGHHWVDGVNEVQIRDRAQLTDAELVERFAATIPRAVRGRSRLPRPVRALRVVDLPPPYTGRLPLGWLYDICYTRDVWMHRVDVARATGRTLALTPDHDGRLVADVVAEWATTHDDPFELELTGPAGGRYRRGTGAGHVEHVEIDAVELVRVLSGRAAGTGVLANALPL